MKIWIITMEDPVYTLDFIKAIIRDRHNDIVGLTIAKGNRLKIGKKRSKHKYLISLLLIMGLPSYVFFVYKTISFKVRKKLSGYLPFCKSPSLRTFSEKFNIPVDYTNNPNAETYLNKLKEAQPDVIINQSQFIIKKELLSIARIGMLNRHNALLPKNRGRLTPFWVLNKQEKETGVSIHFVDEGIDSGPIIVQKSFKVDKRENFRSLVKKNYQLAPTAMIEALDKLENGMVDFLPNDDEMATYNTVPSLKDAWDYRKKRLFRLLID